MRDWSATLSAASLAGVAFRVREDEIEAGRRHAVHTIPNGRHVVEEFGPSPRTYQVTGYVAGDAADGAAAALLALDETAGPVLLVLPTGTAMVAGVEIRRTFDRDRLGYIAVSIRATAAGAVSAPGFGVAVGASLTAAGLLAAVTVAADVVFTAVGSTAARLVGALAIGSSPYAALLTDRLIDAAVSGLAEIETARAASIAPALAVLSSDEDRSTAAADYVDLELDIAELVDQVGEVIADAATWSTGVAAAIRSIGDLASSALWEETAADLLTATAATHSVAYTTDATAAAEAAAAIVPAIVRVSALASVIEVIAAIDYPDRPTAVAARNRLVEAVAAEIERLDSLDPAPGEIIAALSDLRDAAVAALKKRATSLAPVISVTSTAVMPALVWAWRLYGDPTRADEIVARNRLDHPAFVPLQFEALAR
jgi:hypothetical protein